MVLRSLLYDTHVTATLLFRSLAFATRNLLTFAYLLALLGYLTLHRLHALAYMSPLARWPQTRS